MFANLKLYAGIGLIVAGLLGVAYFYISSLNSTIDNLKKQNTSLVIDNKSKDEAIVELSRRAEVETEITKVFDKKRVENKKEYQKKVDKIDENVSQGKDRPVGPLLGDFFNNPDGL